MNAIELSTVATVLVWLVGLGLSGLLLAMCILEGVPRHSENLKRDR